MTIGRPGRMGSPVSGAAAGSDTGWTRTPDNAWYKLLWMPVLAALALGIGLYAGGVPIGRCIGCGVTAGAVVWLVVKSLTLPAPQWPQQSHELQDWGGVRRLWEVTGLEAALERPEYMSRRILVQLAAIADDLLRRRNLTLAHSRATELLRPRGIELLTDPEARAPSKTELRNLITTMTLLATDGGDGSRPLPVPAALVAGPASSRRTPLTNRSTGRGTR